MAAVIPVYPGSDSFFYFREEIIPFEDGKLKLIKSVIPVDPDSSGEEPESIKWSELWIPRQARNDRMFYHCNYLLIWSITII